MHIRKSSLFSNVLIIGIGTVFTKLLSFIMTPFYSSWLTPNEYGQYDLLATYILLCVPLVTLQLDQGLYRFSIENQSKSKEYYSSVFCFTIITSLIAASLVLIVFSIFQLPIKIYLSFIFYFIFYAFFTLNNEYLRGLGKLKSYSRFNILSGVFSVLFSFIFVKCMDMGIFGLLFSFGLSYFTCFTLFFGIFNPLIFFSKESFFQDIRKILKYSVHLIPNSIAWWITNVSDRTLINIFVGNFANGVYAICCKIPTILSIFFGIFNLSFQQVALTELTEEDYRSYYNKVLENIIKLLFTTSMIIIPFSIVIYMWFIKKIYWNGINCIPFLLCGSIFLSIAQYLGDILLVKKETSIIGKSTFIAAIINIILNILLIPKFSVLGASFATMVSYIYLFVHRILKTSTYFSLRMVFKKLCIFTIIFFLFSFLMIKISNNIFLLAIFTIIDLFMFVFINRSIIFIVIHKLKK